MPWANGGGVTKELFAHIDQQSGRILWRISMAGVHSDGPFSHFDGYDRVLVLLEGHGLKLSHRDGTRHELSCAYEMAAFPGDVVTHAILSDGPVQDFNVIVDRATFSPAVTLVQHGNNRCPIKADTLAVFAIDNDLLITDPGMDNYPLQKGDLLLVDAPHQGNWTFDGATTIVTQLLRMA